VVELAGFIIVDGVTGHWNSAGGGRDFIVIFFA
jgi:hypothetical protein